MRAIDKLFNEYAESHQNPVNKRFHWVCIPLIFFSLIGILMTIPFPFIPKMPQQSWLNWGSVLLILGLIYYLSLSLSLFFGFLLISFLVLSLNLALYKAWGIPYFLYINIIIFVIAWIGQFIGHKIEKKKPSFFKDLQFLLVGPGWLLHFIYKKLGIRY